MSALIIGVALGSGLLLVLSAILRVPMPAPRRPLWMRRIEDVVVRSGVKGLTVPRLALASAGASALTGVILLAVTRTWPVACAIALIVAVLPSAAVASRARSNAQEARKVWPDVVDSLVAAVRAGMGLPEAVGALREEGPELLRPHLANYDATLRATGSFDRALTRLKESLADAHADRIIESLRLARDVGGADLCHLLRNLGIMLREDARIRGELRARASWTVNAARLGVAAPWLVLVLISTKSDAAAAYSTSQGVAVLAAGGCACVAAYAAMRWIGRMPGDERTMR